MKIRRLKEYSKQGLQQILMHVITDDGESVEYRGVLHFMPTDVRTVYNEAKAYKNAEFFATKLEIRRVLRSMGKEEALDTLLAGNQLARVEWLDASIIDCREPLVIQCMTVMGVDIEDLKNKIEEYR